MKSSCRIISLLLCIAMMLSIIPFAVFALEEDYPTATVSEVEVTDANRKQTIYVPTKTSDYINNNIGTVDVAVMYQFTANDSEEDLEDSPYKEWFCDYVVRFNKDIPKLSMGLYGSYGGYLDIAFLMPEDIPANTDIYLLRELGLDDKLKYREVVTLVNDFVCGAFNLWEGNYDTTMGVSFMIFQKDAQGNPINQHVVEYETYKLTDKTSVTTTVKNGTENKTVVYHYGGVGLHESGWSLIGKYFYSQKESGTYFLTDSFNEFIKEDPVEKTEQNIEVRDGKNEVLSEEQKTAAADAINEVVEELQENENFTVDSSDIQEKVNSEAIEGAVNKTAQLKIDLQSIAVTTKTEQSQEISTIKVQTTHSTTYDVKPWVTIVSEDTVNNEIKVETRIITNEELAENNITINFKLPVPSTMTGNTVKVTHTTKVEGQPDIVETWTAKVEGSGEDRYVTLSANAFSEYELSQIEETSAVAKIVSGGNTYYYVDLASAVSDAQTNDTIIILANISGEAVTVDKEINIDKNGHTFENAPSAGTNTNVSEENGVYKFTSKTYTVSVTSRNTKSNSTVAAVSGGGDYTYGTSATVVANAISGYQFVGWYRNAYNAEADPLSTSFTYTFTVDQDNISMIAVYKPITGFNIKINGAEYTVKKGSGTAVKQTGLTTKTYDAGTSITISYIGEDGFMYWVNSTDNIISTTPIFEMSVVCDAEIRAVTHGDIEDKHSASITFLNAFDQILSSSRYYDDEKIIFPSVNPSKMGYSFSKWGIQEIPDGDSYQEATEENILAAMGSNDVLHIVPIYIKDAGYYSVKLYIYDANLIKLTEVTPTSSTNYTVADGLLKHTTGSVIDVYLSEIASWAKLNNTDLSARFSYWSVPSNIYDTSTFVPYSFNGSKVDVVSAIADVQFNVVVVINDASTQKSAAVSIPQQYGKEESGKLKLCFTLKYYVPETCTVNESGFVYSVKAVEDENNLVIGANNVYKHITSKTSNELIYTMNATAPNTTATLYVRAYVIYTDANGVIHTDYSTMTSGNYGSMSK